MFINRFSSLRSVAKTRHEYDFESELPSLENCATVSEVYGITVLINIKIIGEAKWDAFKFTHKFCCQASTRSHYMKAEIGVGDVEITSYLIKT